MKKLFLLLAALITTIAVMAQNQSVSGTVTSADGEPLVGATVMGVGTQIGTATDVDGNFTLSLPASVKTLQVSYVGMNTKDVTITPGSKMNIVLDGTNQLDEVIAVAYGTAKKSAFTGSASVLNSEELSKRITTNVADALVGTVPGLQMRGSSGAPGASQGSINIRGIASMYADTDPLVIVDGSPYTASLTNIPQNDIESISVLKDAASAALYGARGAAGVIIITTKRGKSENAQVTVDMKWGANTRADQDYDLLTDPGEYYESTYAAYYNYYRYGAGQTHANAFVNANQATLTNTAYNIYDVPAGQYLIGQNGKLNPYATKGRKYTYNGETYYLTNDNWTDEAYHTALRQEYNVSVNGATGKATYYASVGYLDEDGIIEYSGYRRIAARFKGDFQAKRWLKLGVNVGYVHADTESNPNLDQSAGSTNLMYYANNIAPIYPIYVRTVDANGNPVIKSNENGQIYDFGVANQLNGYGGINRPFGQTGNPFGNNRYNSSTTEGNQMNGTFTADFTFTSWLKANITSNAIWGNSYDSTYNNPYFGPAAGTNGNITKVNQQTIRTNNVQSLTFTKDFGRHSVNVLLGHEYYQTTLKYLGAQARGGFSPAIKEINAFADKYNSAGYESRYNVEGFFGSAQYDYDSKYFGSLSYRRDASSRFAKDHRWGNFWSIGAAWIINKDFLQDKEWINLLKLKASIGQQGNDNIGNWAYTDLYTISASSSTDMAPSFYRVGNPDITWETTTNFNVGVEFGFFGNRLTGSVDFYNKKVSDLLFWLSIPESMGSRGYYDNVGDLRNTGVEIQLNGAIIHNKLIDWNVNLNMAHNQTKILSLPESKTQELGGFSQSDASLTMSSWYAVGGPMYNAFMPEVAGIDPETGQQLYWLDSSLKYITSDGSEAWYTDRPGTKRDETTTNPNIATNYTQGSTLPKLFGGFGTSIRVGSFDASVAFDYQIGGKMFDTRYMGYMNPSNVSGGSNVHKDWINSWTPEHPTNIPHWQYNDGYVVYKSNRFLTDASYLNFASFSAGYTLPKFWNEINSLRVYVQGENLCYWSKRKGFDPRYSYTSGASVSAYSAVRTISGGIQVNF